ncbi:Transport protein particle subunit trs120 Short=TRAPP subunit trs120 [Rhizoctonia solani AG-1 IB]|uniref:Transport protein particle subunit trs120 Short=TRAPP subunit trs120 n=1 Tax=Thanatephorus cucumeris (strain AG1-IB / isolate 7/3/14) TaxID=1108050 RepID=M5BN77_THACB|nr:Transport protein particle subunit trs120 Short=TRAPP subunit trs120 [Rhizoctonia solani AG-1 IB]
METAPFATLGHVRVLLVPVGPIRKPTFDKWAALIRSFENIRLDDIPPDPREERARFMPSTLSTGYIHLSYPTHPPPEYYGSLSLFRPSVFPLAVIGIADCSYQPPLPKDGEGSQEPLSLSGILAEFNARLSQLFSSRAAYPLASRCFAFEDSYPPNGQNSESAGEGGGGGGQVNINVGDTLPGLVIIPSEIGHSKRFYLGTLLAELCGAVLGEFGSLASFLETPAGLDALSTGLFPTLGVAEETPAPGLTFGSHGMVSNGPISRSHSDPHYGMASTLAPRPTPKRQSTVGVGSVSRKKGGTAPPTGRFGKVMGDFYLLSGKLTDAMAWYNEAISMFKSPIDYAWHASALEGFATAIILDAWAQGDGLNTSMAASNMREPWADVLDRLSQAVGLYWKCNPTTQLSDTAPVTADSEYSLLSLLYTEAALRASTLLFAIWSAKGWGPVAFGTLVRGGIPPIFANLASEGANAKSDGPIDPTKNLGPTLSHLSDRPTAPLAPLLRMSTITQISRAQIANVAGQAHGPWLQHLQPRDRLRALTQLATLYACLGFRRKEVYILRELLACIVDLVICAREETGTKVSTGRMSMIADPNESRGGGWPGPGANQTGEISENTGEIGVRIAETTEGNESILRIVKYICEIYGIDVSRVEVGTDVADTGKDGGGVDDDIELDSPRFGWREVQVGVVREAVQIAEALPGMLVGTRLLTVIKFVEVVPLASDRMPVERPWKDLVPSEADSAKDGATWYSFNPRARRRGNTKATIVQNEIVEFAVTLQNPFAFDLEVQSLSLSTTGAPIQTAPVSLLIPANSFHIKHISCTPLEAGTLVVRGCMVQLPNSTPKEFALPLASETQEASVEKRRTKLLDDMVRVKASGLDARRRSTLMSEPPTQERKEEFLECRVVPQLPLLRVRRTSLTQGALMLYAGECFRIRLTVENVSLLPIDFLRMSFEDSTLPALQQALAEGELTIAEAYETEYELVNKPVLKWDLDGIDASNMTLAPRQKMAVWVTCFGKEGCTNATMRLHYSLARRDQVPSPESFFLRSLYYPLLVTVYHTLECHAMDIVPYGGGLTSDDSPKLWCLFMIDVRNLYGQPFEVTFERTQQGTESASTTRLVAPGATSRITIPVRRLSLSPEQASRDVPTLSDRQFVVSKVGFTAIQQELFWYRETLFDIVKGRWSEPGTGRTGEVSLRQQRLTLPMLETLRLEDITVQLSMVPDNPEGGIEIKVSGVNTYRVPLNEFVHLRTEVHNLTTRDVPLILDIKATRETRLEHILFQEPHSDIHLGIVGAEIEARELGLCFVASGEYVFIATVRHAGFDAEEVATTVRSEVSEITVIVD